MSKIINKKLLKLLAFLTSIVVLVGLFTPSVVRAIRDDSVFEIFGGSYIAPSSPLGYDFLLAGISRYLNFNSTVGSSGYGFRDNSGTLQFKNSGGSWTDFGSGSGVSFGSEDQIPVTNATTDDFDYSDELVFNGSTLIVGDGGGNGSHTIGGNTVQSNIEAHSEGTDDLGGISIHRHSNNSNFGGHLIYLKSGGTHSSPTAVADGSTLGSIYGTGYDGTDYEATTQIEHEVDGSVSNNVVPGAIVFSTSATNTAGLTERFRIKNNGTFSFDGESTILSSSELNLVDGMTGKTGSDTNFVTGTAGTSGNLLEWDSNGDAIEATISAERLYGRGSGSAGDAQELLVGAGLSFSSTALTLEHRGIIVGDSGDSTLASTTEYAPLAGARFSGTETDTSIPFPEIAKTDTLYAYISSAQPVTGSLILRLRINGANTALTLTIPAGSSAGSYGTSSTVSISAGDRINYIITNNATSTSPRVTFSLSYLSQ